MEKEGSNKTPVISREEVDQSNPEKEIKDAEQSTDANDPAALVRVENAPSIETTNQGNVNISERRVTEKTEAENLESIQSLNIKENYNKGEKSSDDEDEEPIFDGTELPDMDPNIISSPKLLNNNDDSESQGSVWPEKAAAITNFVRQKSLVAVSTVLRRLSGKSEDGLDAHETDTKDWNPFFLIGISRDEHKPKHGEDLLQPVAMKGRIILYTKLGCHVCKEARKFLHGKRLRYVEINIDIYPSRKIELERIALSSSVPRIFFNEILIGGLDELRGLDESGKLEEKIEYVTSETPSYEAPLPPLSGEDDPSSAGAIDELALIARKMKGAITVRDRFYKVRRFTKCFLGSEAVDFLTEDQYLEREEAVEFGRKLANKLFFRNVEDQIFEDGNHLYRFLDDDPLISQCQNISRGIIDSKPKPIPEISSELRFLCHAMFEAYASEDGKHVDYRSIHGSEEFARYLRIVEELQRVELFEMPREEKLSFFINLYNMMAIHAILVWGHPTGALERRRFFGNFKYVIGGSTFSLSAIYNGILRGNQRPPYNLIKPFAVSDRRLKVALPHTEPLVHFALGCGTRSGPALRCYSPGNIDKELIDAACYFLRNGGLYVDLAANVVYVSKILRWYSADFGKNEIEVLKHAANYLEPADTQAFLELISTTQIKVIYQPYDWGLNH
ncbi:hypothetical protein CASFOL_036350 [Castilleja foliolosa]|uniref:DEP domain-containing protein n=1 Tax=Castilleja foliolosa TaxID=1961234 RepID=A0ABD3BW78_9LAMI